MNLQDTILINSLIVWAKQQYEMQVTHRPDINRYKRTLHETWMHIINHLEEIAAQKNIELNAVERSGQGDKPLFMESNASAQIALPDANVAQRDTASNKSQAKICPTCKETGHFINLEVDIPKLF